MPLQHYINHISLIVDRSASMQGQPVVEVFDRELQYLKQRSIELNQETRISIYLFNEQVECLTFDMDVMRFNSLKGYYGVSGWTALIDAVLKSTEDNRKLPEIFGDHAFLQYVITDGQENRSRHMASELSGLLGALPDNWTTACLVPDKTAASYAQKYGFNGGSISIWDPNAVGAFDNLGKQFSKVTDTFMDNRAKGIRGTKNLFTMDSTGLKESALRELNSRLYDVYPVNRDAPIREYVESLSGEKYRLGSAYYQPVKPVLIQDFKNILVQNAKDGKIYEGSNIRTLLGIPQQSVEVNPGQHRDWRIFVQSTSVNRKLFKDTFVLVRR